MQTDQLKFHLQAQIDWHEHKKEPAKADLLRLALEKIIELEQANTRLAIQCNDAHQFANMLRKLHQGGGQNEKSPEVQD